MGSWQVTWKDESPREDLHVFVKIDSIVRMRIRSCSWESRDCYDNEEVVVQSNHREFPSTQGWFQVFFKEFDRR